MQFQHPEYLLALLAVPAMIAGYFYNASWKKNIVKKIGDQALVQQLVDNYSPNKHRLKFCLFILAFVLLVLALANPRIATGGSNVKHSGIDVMIALDVSKSMLAQDIKPNRLERAKQLVLKLIDKMPNNRVGMVVFAGRAYLQMPLTSDHIAAKLYLSTIDTEMVPTQGTVISDALTMSFAAFDAKEKKYKSIIVISDGEDHDSKADKLAQSLAEEGVVVNTVGIGSVEGATINDPITGEAKKDMEGKTVVTRLNEEGLKKIAGTTGGVYHSFTNTDEVANAINNRLKTMEQRGITETSLANYQNYFPYLLIAAVILLLFEFFISENKRIKRRNQNTSTVFVTFLFVIIMLPLAGLAQNSNQLLQQGNTLYKEKKYKEAADTYKKITEKAPANTSAQYNLGNALYKSNNTGDALKAYEQAMLFSKDDKDKATIWYNKGVLLQNEKKLPECIEAYKTALKINPSDEDTRLNLQKALQQQQQEQKQPDQQKKEKKNQQQKQQQQQPQQPKPQPSKMSKKEAEEKLKALLQQEKNLHDKLKKQAPATIDKPEKDW